MIRYCIVIGLLLYGMAVAAQEYEVMVKHLSTAEGLSNRFVRSMMQDSKGYMWFGTDNGLNRYDGSRFEVLQVATDAFRGHTINHLCEDVNQHLWVFFCARPDMDNKYSGIRVVNLRSMEWQSIEDYLGKALPFALEELVEVYPDPITHQLFITTTTGDLWRYSGAQQLERIYQQAEGHFLSSIWIGKRYIWLAYRRTIMALDRDGQVHYEQAMEGYVDDPPTNEYCILGELDSSSVWVQVKPHNSTELNYHWTPSQGTLVQQKDIAAGKTAPIFGGTKLHYRPKRQCYVQYSALALHIYDEQFNVIHQEDRPVYTETMSSFWIDQQENIWVGTLARGIMKISYHKKRFANYMEGKSIRSMTTYHRDSMLLVGSYGGRHRLQRCRSHHESHTAELLEDVANTMLYFSPKRQTVLGNIYGDVIVWDREGQNIEQIYRCKQQVWDWQSRELGNHFREMWAIKEVEDGSIWIGTDQGLLYLPWGADSIQFPFLAGDERNLPNSIVTHLHQNEVGLWITASTGLYCLRPDQRLIHYHSTKNPPYQLPFDDLLHLHEDEKGQFYVATRGGGWFIFDPKTGDHQQWTTEQGLSHNVTYATLEDEFGYFWVSSDRGLMRIRPSINFIQTFMPANGIPHEEFNREAAYKAPDGYLYFGGLNGVVEIQPKDFLVDAQTAIPPLDIVKYRYFDGAQSVMVDGKARLEQEGQINLAYRDRAFELTLSLLEYHATARKRYAYQLEGQNDDWVYTTNPTIRVEGLRAGRYLLRIKAELSNGRWSPVLKEIPVVVHQPFYLQGSFLLGVGVVLLLAGIFYLRWRERRLHAIQQMLEEEVKKRTRTIEKQADALRELDEMKSRFFANISHELRTPLTLILGPIEQALNATKAFSEEQTNELLRLMQRNGLRLKGLIEQILQLSKLESNTVNMDEQPHVVADLIQRLWSNFEWQAEQKSITWTLKQEVPAALQAWVDADKVEKIINNLLSNALKHTPEGGSITLESQWNAELEVWQVTIRDTGQGIPVQELSHIFERFYQAQNGKAMGGTGIGLSLSRELVQLMGGEIVVQSQLGAGSQFTLQLPLRPLSQTDMVSTQVLPESPSTPPLPLEVKHEATILIVEDHADLRLYLSDLIGNHYQVHTATNGKEALAFFNTENHRIDLVISDVMMPEMDGFELLSELRTLPPEAQVPVILLTARTAQRDRLKALRIGVDDYLTKPFSHQELFARIHNLLTHHRQRRTWLLQAELEAEEATIGTTPPMSAGTELLETSAPPVVESDAWLEELEVIVTREVSNSQFNLAQLAYDVHLSERQLRRKIKTKTGMTPNQYFRTIKLEIARQHLETRRYQTVAEVAYKVGFSNAHYFSKLYEAQYGKKPIEYLR